MWGSAVGRGRLGLGAQPPRPGRSRHLPARVARGSEPPPHTHTGPSPSASDGPASAVPVLASLYVPAGVTVAAGTVSSRPFAQKSFGKEQQDCLPRPVAVGADRI